MTLEQSERAAAMLRTGGPQPKRELDAPDDRGKKLFAELQPNAVFSGAGPRWWVET